MANERVLSEWRTVSTDRQLDFAIFKLREDRVSNPRDGSTHRRVVIEAPDWVNIIPLTVDDQVVMIRQFRFGIVANTLEIPGGMVELGEDPQTAALRELEEESGYRADQVIALGKCRPNPAIQNNWCHSFLALGCRQVHQGMPDTGEEIQVELHPKASIPSLIRNEEITHALVLVAFLRLELSEQRNREASIERP